MPKRYTITLSDEIAKKLDEKVKGNFRGKKGAISIIVENALAEYLKGRPKRGEK